MRMLRPTLKVIITFSACTLATQAQDKAVVPPSKLAFEAMPGKANHAGLFVGICEFIDDPNISPVKFAVNDAIQVAHYFVLELKLIEPANAALALSGEPEGEPATGMLTKLKESGVRVVQARKSTILVELNRIAAKTQADTDMMLFFLSSHGFEIGNVIYAMPRDGLFSDLADTGINMNSVEVKLADPKNCKAGKRILMLDACRDNPFAEVSALGPAMSDAFAKSLAKTKGQVVLHSCDTGQRSFWDDRNKLGRFTFDLLSALRGAADSNDEGVVNLSHVLEYVRRETDHWARDQKGHAQQPRFEGAEDAREIPLAIDSKKTAALAERTRQKTEQIAKWVARLNELRNQHRGAISGQRLEQGEYLLESADSSLNDFQRELKQVFVDLVEGRIAAAYVESAWKGIEQKHTPVVPEDPDALFRSFEQKRIMKLVEAEKFDEALRQVTFYEDSFTSDDFSKRLKDLLASRLIPVKPEREKLPDVTPPNPTNEKTLTLDLGGGVKMELVLIPSGSFLMGSPEGEESRDPDENQHRVEITKPFYMGKYEVTNAQYRRFKQEHDSGRSLGVNLNDDSQPVVKVSWNDVTAFCKWLANKSGRNVRLPTEAEWEYSCRSSTSTPFYFGSTISPKDANCDAINTSGSGSGRKRITTIRAGSFPNNSFGLHDMHGNAGEWCLDWYASDYYSTSPLFDPQGPLQGEYRLMRGGSMYGFSNHCRSAKRGFKPPDSRDCDNGFRVVVPGTP